MPAIFGHVYFDGNRIRGLVPAVTGDEPLRKAEAGIGGAGTAGATWVRGIGVIAVPVNTVPVYVRTARTIMGASIVTEGGVGSCVVDIWKKAIGSYPPTSADSICGSSKPTISAGKTYTDTALTGWTIAVAAGDVLMFSLTSSSVFTMIAVQLQFS